MKLFALVKSIAMVMVLVVVALVTIASNGGRSVEAPVADYSLWRGGGGGCISQGCQGKWQLDHQANFTIVIK